MTAARAAKAVNEDMAMYVGDRCETEGDELAFDAIKRGYIFPFIIEHISDGHVLTKAEYTPPKEGIWPLTMPSPEPWDDDCAPARGDQVIVVLTDARGKKLASEYKL